MLQPNARLPLAALTAALALPSLASAHIDATSPLPRTGSDQIKERPCGAAGSVRGANVHTFQPGEVISITVNEFIGHPGYIRFAFDQDGDDGFADPRSIDPSLELPAGGRACEMGEDPTHPGAVDHCGAPDFCNNSTVLADNVNAKSSAAPSMATYQIKLPNVECDNCTLQIIQVMTDIAFHGYHDPSKGTANIYYECLDLILADQGNDAASFGPQPALGQGAVVCGSDAVPANNLPTLDGGDEGGTDQSGAGGSLGNGDPVGAGGSTMMGGAGTLGGAGNAAASGTGGAIGGGSQGTAGPGAAGPGSSSGDSGCAVRAAGVGEPTGGHLLALPALSMFLLAARRRRQRR